MFTTILSIICGILYRMGGSSKWHTLYRDLGVPLVSVGILYLMRYTDPLMLTFSFVLLYGAMTTYFDFVNKWFGRSDKEFWVNWLLIGISYSLSILPIIVVYKLWTGFIIRTTALPILYVVTDFWIERIDFSKYPELSRFAFTKDHTILKEFVRGFLNCITLPLLAIG